MLRRGQSGMFLQLLAEVIPSPQHNFGGPSLQRNHRTRVAQYVGRNAFLQQGRPFLSCHLDMLSKDKRDPPTGHLLALSIHEDFRYRQVSAHRELSSHHG